MNTSKPLSFSRLLQQFFVERLMQQLQASPCTVAAYRDTFRLLLAFVHRQLGKQPSDLALEDHGRPAQRAIRHCDGLALDRVVDDLVPDQNPQRIGARRVSSHESNDDIIISQVARLPRRDELGPVDRRDPVACRPAAMNLLPIDRRLREIEAVR